MSPNFKLASSQKNLPGYALGFTQADTEITLAQLPVRGQVPGWLTGMLLRNGPGTLRVGQQQYRHWFDGLAMLHKFTFQQGRVSYANKFLDCQAYRQARQSGQISYSEFATDPCRSLFQRVFALFSPHITDSAKVNVAKIANRFMALGETPLQVEFDPETLASVGVFSYETQPAGQMTTVHPHFEADQSLAYNLVTRFSRISQYRLYGVAADVPPKLLGAIPSHAPAYLHSFGMTQNYFIIAEFPLVVNPLSLLLWLKPFIENFQWQPQRGTPFYLLNRHTGELVGRYESEPFFAFHHINAFEQQGEVVVDLAAYPDSAIINAFYLNRLKDTASQLPFGQLRRYRIPLNGQRATYETLSAECLELPRFDYARYNTRADYRFVYGMSVNRQQPEGFYNQLVKIDLQNQQTTTWFEANCYPGEPVFVSAPGAAAEDEGVILSVVLDAVRGTSFLLILEASAFEEIARAEVPQPILHGYHGQYFTN
jgi:carotenoid cleavage dioxygenase-like enzyme